MTSILIIDDDVDFCRLLRAHLAPHSISLAMQHDGESGLIDLRSYPYDMILLNVMLPGMSGLELLSRIRSFSALGVLLLSAADSQAAGIAGLDEGADDYISKPFDGRELVLRIRAILRRTRRQAVVSQTQTDLDGSGLNSVPRDAFYPGFPLDLTDVEHRILNTFLDSPGVVLAREELVSRVFRRTYDPTDRSLDVHISRLRKKLEGVNGLNNPIRSIRNAGYLFSSDLSR